MTPLSTTTVYVPTQGENPFSACFLKNGKWYHGFDIKEVKGGYLLTREELENIIGDAYMAGFAFVDGAMEGNNSLPEKSEYIKQILP